MKKGSSLMATLKLSEKGKGFYFACFSALLCLATAIYYYVAYNGDQYYSSYVFYTLLAALPAAALMMLAKLDGFIPTVLTILSGVAILLFIYAMYWDVSVVLVGIDKTSFEPRFIACCILMVLSFLISEVALYSKMKKMPKETT